MGPLLSMVYNGGEPIFYFKSFSRGTRCFTSFRSHLVLNLEDGYAYHPNFPGHNCAICRSLSYDPKKWNGLILIHPVIAIKTFQRIYADS